MVHNTQHTTPCTPHAARDHGPGVEVRGAGATARWRWQAALAVVLLLAGCEEETTIVKYRPMLGGLPGSESGTPVTGVRSGTVDPTVVPEDQLVVKNKDGTTTLMARSAHHLMIHIHNTMKDNDEKLFLDQVLSQRTKEEYYQRGLDPHEAFVTLKDRQADVNKLFDAMPMGEYTPGLFLRPVGGGVQRLEIQGPASRELAWTGFDMVMEKGSYRLRWFYSPE